MQPTTATQPAYMGRIPGGLPGVRATLKIMVNVTRSALSPNSGDAARTSALLTLRQTAASVVQLCPEKDWRCEAAALQAFVRDSIRYVRDMRDKETLQFPDYTLAHQSGDCDDKSILLATLAECIGFHTRFCAIGVRGESFSHVSAQLLIPGVGWTNAETIPVDDQGSKAPLGWFPPDATCIMLAHI